MQSTEARRLNCQPSRVVVFRAGKSSGSLDPWNPPWPPASKTGHAPISRGCRGVFGTYMNRWAGPRSLIGPTPTPLSWIVVSPGLLGAIPQVWGLETLEKPQARARSYMKVFRFVATSVGTVVPGPGSEVCTRWS